MNSEVETKIVTKLLPAVALLTLLLPKMALGQERDRIKPEDSVKAVLTISQFRKLDGPARLDALETVLPQLLRARMLRYTWLEIVTGDSGKSEHGEKTAGLEAGKNGVPGFTLEGDFIVLGEKIRADLTLRNKGDGSVEFRGSDVFGEDTIFEAVERFGQTIADTIQMKVNSQAEKRQARFGVVSSFTCKSGKTYEYLGGVLAPTVFGQLSKTKLHNVSFRSVAGLDPSPPEVDAVVSGEYSVGETEKGNEVLTAALIRESKSGASFRVEARGPLNQLPLVTRALTKRILEIVRGRITPDGQWRRETVSLVNAKPEEYLAQARTYQQADQQAPAILMYRKAIQEKLGYIEARSMLAQLYVAQEDYESAVSEYQEILLLDNKLAPIRYGLAIANLKLGNAKAAVAEVEELRKLGPNDPQTLAKLDVILGDAALLDGKNKEAIQYYNHASGLIGESPELYRSIAKAYRADDDLQQAADYLEKGHARFPDNRQIVADLASIFNEQGRKDFGDRKYTQAVKEFEKTIALNPDDPHLKSEALGHHGVIVAHFLSSPDRKKGITDLEKSVALEGAEWNHRFLGALYKEDGNYLAALKSLQQGIEIEPTPMSYRVMAEVYRLMNKYEAAVEAGQAALRLRPNYAAGYAELAETYRASNDLDRAIENLNKYITLQPKDFSGYAILAEIYEQKKANNQALDVVQKGLAQLPDSVQLHVQLGDLYRLEKKYAMATEACQKAIKLSSNSPDAYWVIGSIQIEQHKYESALVSARKVIELKGDGFGLLYEAYKGLDRDREAVQVLKGYLEKSPGEPMILTRLANIYEERLFDYEESYKLYKEVYRIQPKDLTTRQNFAETNLTTERYDDALALANEILADPTLSPAEKLSMKLIAIAALLSEKKTAVAFSELGEFIRYHESLREFEQSWTFGGIRNFVTKSKALGEPEKTLLLALVNILESPKSEADKKVVELKNNLPSLFQQLQKVSLIRGTFPG